MVYNYGQGFVIHVVNRGIVIFAYLVSIHYGHCNIWLHKTGLSVLFDVVCSSQVPSIKEGVLLRNVSYALVLCDHFPGGGILELQTGSSWKWPFIVCLFWE